jgi:ribosomal protein L17
MAGGLTRFRHLSRTSAHRQALLRNIVTTLIKNETLHTTWHKAKEAQRLAEKLITMAKRNNETARRRAQGILYVSLTSRWRFCAADVSDVKKERGGRRRK